jgi:signal transduction histidine kinase
MLKSIYFRVFLSFLLLIAIAILDFNVTFEVSLAPLYLIPVLVFSYQDKLSFGYSLLFALLSDGVWYTIDYYINPYSLEVYHVLNGIIKTSVTLFFVVALRQFRLIRKFKNSLEVKSAELALKNQELAQSNIELNKFIGMAAHDIRNPIGAILMCTEMLESDDTIHDEAKEFIKMIQSTASHSLEIVNDTLNISKIQSGTIELSLQKNDYIEFVRQNITLNKMLAEAKGQQILFETNMNQTDLLFDKNRMNQVLNNLLTNAIKYSEKNKVINVTVALINDDLIRTSIIDQGLGIDEKYHATLFEPFTTTANTPTNNESKTGLGLAIVKKIVELHHGTIGFTSKVGEGSVFYYDLPIHGEKAKNA